MKCQTIRSVEELYNVVDHCDAFSAGDQVRVIGKFSQTISKAFNAYHKAVGGRAKARLAAGATFGALCFGPVGVLISGGATAGLFAASRQLRELKQSYRALPCASEVEELALAGFELIHNDGSEVLLIKT